MLPNCVKYLLVVFLLYSAGLGAQQNWEDEANDFMEGIRRYSDYTDAELKSVYDNATSIINSFCDNCPAGVLSDAYQTRADIGEALLARFNDEIDSTFRAQHQQLIFDIAADYEKAIQFCPDCKCDLLFSLREFYFFYGNKAQYERVAGEAKAWGVHRENDFFGVDLDYMAPNNIVGIELGALLAVTNINQPKNTINRNGKRARNCGYEYPMAMGMFFGGFETSLTHSAYKAVKVDLIWLRRIGYLHPLQFLYAWNGKKTAFVYRPEAGVAFSTFAIGYAFNLPFSKDFGYLATHNLTVRFTIPVIKFSNVPGYMVD